VAELLSSICAFATESACPPSNLCFPLHGPAKLNCAHARIGTKLTSEGKRATGVEIALDGQIQRNYGWT